MKRKIFSAIQPTGKLTVGHYSGVLKNWLRFQDTFNCYYCIADLHSLTNISIYLNRNKYLIKDNIFNIISFLLALGIDYNKCVIFLQSSVKEHVQLNWILNCYTYMGELKRMTQFKEKNLFYKKKINSGIFNYPVLMASDILLYKSNYVSIGFDQIQHVELSRKIARRFNYLYSTNVFNIPKYILSKNGSKIMSLSNPTKKMSKSNLDISGTIFLLDNINLLEYKINNSVTDSDNPPKIIFDYVNKPGISNLLNIISIINNISINSIEEMFINFSYKDFKKYVIRELNFFLSSLQKKFFFFRNQEYLLKDILFNGKIKAKKYAKKMLWKVKKILGIDYFF